MNQIILWKYSRIDDTNQENKTFNFDKAGQIKIYQNVNKKRVHIAKKNFLSINLTFFFFFEKELGMFPRRYFLNNVIN